MQWPVGSSQTRAVESRLTVTNHRESEEKQKSVMVESCPGNFRTTVRVSISTTCTVKSSKASARSPLSLWSLNPPTSLPNKSLCNKAPVLNFQNFNTPLLSTVIVCMLTAQVAIPLTTFLCAGFLPCS